MKALRLNEWSQRQQVVAIILVGGLAIVALWYFMLYPQHKRRRALEKRIADMRSHLERSNYLVGEDVLNDRKNVALREHDALRGEWAELVRTIGSFSGDEDQVAQDVGHIDFKMALYEAQERLNQKAAVAGISIPPELGMIETVESDEDARTLMMQLRALEKLVDLLLDIDISLLRSVEPLAPIVHGYGDKDDAFIEEYPVHVEFLGNLRNLYDLYHAVLVPERVFALRRIRVKAASPINEDLLRVRAILSAVVFLRDPSVGELSVKVTPTYVAPRGY